MKGNRLAEQLQRAMMEATKALPGAPVADLVAWVRKHYRALIEQLQDEWINTRLTSLFRGAAHHEFPMKRGRPSIHNPQQRRLTGFEDIPFQFTVEPRGKRRIRLPNATLDELKQRRELILNSARAELPQLNELISIMESYNRYQPGIKVRVALKLRDAGRRASELG